MIKITIQNLKFILFLIILQTGIFCTFAESMEPGDPLPRIILSPPYQAFVYATGLSSPDALALSPSGDLYVSEESAGRISKITEEGSVITFVEGLSSPEGIAFDNLGNLYAVEDIQNGRVLCYDSTGTLSIVATDRAAPEGITLSPLGELLITESTVQFVSSPFDYQTYVTRVEAGYSPDRFHTALFLWSYSGITTDGDGLIYVCNEASGTGTTNSVLTIDPNTGVQSLFCSGLTACEGLAFSPGKNFPIFVAEEDLGDGHGRLSEVNESGSHSTFATGFLSIEDVLVDDLNRIFVTEDGSGSIIMIIDTTSIAIQEYCELEEYRLNVFPNPVTDELNIALTIPGLLSYQDYLKDDIEVTIYNLNGTQVFHDRKSYDETIRWFPSEKLSQGLYLICIGSSQHSLTEKIMLLR
ncbi:T9SS type A sorting domain-containing protein [bacterium]|nr:T9SS type A sorting domain-containing protein [bacterium]